MRRAILALCLVAAACSSTPRTPNPGRPRVDVVQLGSMFFGSGYTAPMTMQVSIVNVSKEPITIQRVRIDPGAGMGQYSFYPQERIINTKLEPGQGKQVSLMVTAYTNVTRLQPSEPLSVRAFVDYLHEGRRYRELYMYRDVRE